MAKELNVFRTQDDCLDYSMTLINNERASLIQLMSSFEETQGRIISILISHFVLVDLVSINSSLA